VCSIAAPEGPASFIDQSFWKSGIRLSRKQPGRPSTSHPSEKLAHVLNLNEQLYQDHLLNRIAQNICKKSYRQQDKRKQAEQQK
jgi:hypothetical protein